MAIYVYRSTDTSAPELNGFSAAATLINVLDACLVTGYGEKTAIGQTKVASGTGTAMYKMNVGSRSCLGVDDTGTNVARVRGYTDASVAGVGYLNGLRPFPQEYQQAGGAYLYKSGATTNVARPQVLISDGTMIYFWVDTLLDGGTSGRCLFCFGDIHSYNIHDSNPCVLVGTGPSSYNTMAVLAGPLAVQADHWLASKYDNLSQSIQFCKTPLNGMALTNQNYVMGQTGQLYQYPDPITGGCNLTGVLVAEIQVNGSYILRGRFPGLQAPCHSMPFNTGDTISGTTGTPLEGRTFEAFKIAEHNGHTWTGNCLIETSDTQRTTNFR